MDNLLGGSDSVEGALKLFKDLTGMLAKGGFLLRKFRSSHSQVLEGIPPDLQEPMPSLDLVDLHSSHYPKALGLAWDSRNDTMSTAVQLPKHFTSTKRGVISDVARTFDVLGWITPVIILMKVLFQKLWELKVDWDEQVPDQLRAQHEKWREELPLLSTISLPRCYFSAQTALTVQLHGFCDSSESAYAAVIYLRATYPDSPTTFSW